MLHKYRKRSNNTKTFWNQNNNKISHSTHLVMLNQNLVLIITVVIISKDNLVRYLSDTYQP